MRAGSGKAKGSAFERVVSKQLSLWLTNGERDDCLWRSAMSGGRATLQLNKDIINKAQSGDLTAIAPEAYVICERSLFECKFYRDLQITEGILKGTGVFKKFWGDTVKAANRFSKIPILIAKQNFMPVVLVCPITCDIFDGTPILVLRQWEAALYLFDEATSRQTAQRERPVSTCERKQAKRSVIAKTEDSAPRAPQVSGRRSVI